MSGTEGNGDPDSQQPPQPPPKPARPSLPSIQSLFGISREDDLDALLQIDSSSEGHRGETRATAGTPPTESQAQPPTLHRPPSAASHSSRPFPRGDLRGSSLPGRSRRRSSGSSVEHAASSSHAGPHAFSDASSSPLSPPETPESASSGRPAQRMVAGRPLYSPLTQSIASSSSTHSSARAESSRAGVQATAEHSLPPSPHPFRASSSSPFAPFPPPGRAGINPELPSDSPFAHQPHLLEGSRRRHTIGDGTWESVPDSRTHPAVRPPSRPQTTASRSRAYQPYPTLPPSWADAPDRLLPPLPGPSSQSESQQRPSTSSRPKRTSHHASSSIPSSSHTLLPARPSTSPSPFQSHPPSSFPRRLSTAGSSSNVVYIPPVSSPTDPSPTHSRPSSSRRPPSAGSSSEHASHDEAHPSTPPAPRSSKAAGSSSSGGNKYECQFCRKTFNRPSSLKIHVNTHTGEKPFACPYPGCGRRFSVMSNMRRHSRVHSQPRLNEPLSVLDGMQDAEGEPDPEGGEIYEMESMELERPPLIPGGAGSGTGTSSSVPSSGSRSSLHRGSSSASPAGTASST